MALSDNAPLADTGNSIPTSSSQGKLSFASTEFALTGVNGPSPDPAMSAVTGQTLPAWSVALPLWASEHWLWLTHSGSGPIHYWMGTVGQIITAGHTPTLEQAPFTISYSLIVLDCRAVETLPDAWWPQIEQMLAPGGLLLICCRRNKRLPRRVRVSAPKLCPSAWHIIEPGQEGNWHLRPASPSMRRITLELNPPYTTRVWLARMLHRWWPQRNTLNCLPVWADDELRTMSDQSHQSSTRRGARLIALLDGVLSDESLNEVAGREVRRPLSLLHTAGVTRWRDKHLLFLVEAGARRSAATPFALVKWGRGAWVKSLVSEQAAMSQVRATSDPVLLASCPPSWGPFEVGPDALVSLERYFPSQSIYTQFRVSLWPRPLVKGHFQRASSWLLRFAEATLQAHRPLDEALLEEHIETPLRAFTDCFGDDFVPPEAIDGIIATAKTHIGLSVPLTAEHGDLWPSNLLLPKGHYPTKDEGPGYATKDEGRRTNAWSSVLRPSSGNAQGLYVVDWEHYRPMSLGGFDVLFFCATYVRDFPWRPMGWMEYETALSRAFVQRTWLAAQIERTLTDYCAAIELPRALVPTLLSVLMARISVRHVASAPGRKADTQGYWPTMFRAWCRRPADSWLDVWANEKL